MIRNYKYRVYPNKTQISLLEELLKKLCSLYNAGLSQRIAAYRAFNNYGIIRFMQDGELRVIKNKGLSLYDQTYQIKGLRELDDFNNVNFTVIYDVFNRLDLAYKAFFRRVKLNKENPGFPRFKRYREYNMVCYTNGFKIGDNKKLYMQNIGYLKVKWHRELPVCKIKQCKITRENKRWFINFVIETEYKKRYREKRGIVGLDVGIMKNNLVVDSDGKFFDNPQWFRESQLKLRLLNQELSRRKRYSKNWYDTLDKIRETHCRIKNQRVDVLNKISAYYVRRYGTIVIEDLNIKDMIKNKYLSKGVLDSGFGYFKQMLEYKSYEANRDLIKIDPKDTSQNCSNCGKKVKKSLCIRVHKCPYCGIELDRDMNAALNIKKVGVQPSLLAQSFAGLGEAGVSEKSKVVVGDNNA